MKLCRQDDLLQYINKRNSVSTSELLERFQVSRATINRDLIDLEKEGVITRVHGGVVSNEAFQTFEPSIAKKEMSRREEKEAIAREALRYVEDHQTIILDSGSTTWYLAKELAQSKRFENLTVVTCDLKNAYTLAENGSLSLFVLGGMKQPEAYDLWTPQNIEILETLSIDKYFMACTAFDSEIGLTQFNQNDAFLKSKMLELSGEHILCSDSSKYGVRKRWKVCDVEALDIIITDGKLGQEAREELSGKCRGLKIVPV